MKFDFELPVAIHGKPAVRKSTTTVIGTVPVGVEVEECDRHDLDPVARLVFGDKKNRSEHTLNWHEGNFFISQGPSDNLPLSFVPNTKSPGFPFTHVYRIMKMVIDESTYQQRRGSIFPSATRRTRASYSPVELKPISSLRLESIYQEELEAQIEAFRTTCAQLLHCEGNLFRRVSEPILGVDIIEKNGFPTSYVRPMWRGERGLPTAKNEEIPPHAAFRLDDETGLEDFCASAGVEYRKSPDIEMIDATKLEVDSARITLFSAAARIVRKAQDWIGDHAVIDEIYEIVQLSRDDDDYPANLADLLRQAVDVHRSGIRVFSNDFDVLATECAADMWDASAIDIQLSASKPFP